MANGPKLTAQDKAWMAQCDAETLASAEMIENDTTRYAAAQKAAAAMATEAKKKVDAMNSIASGSADVQQGFQDTKGGKSSGPIKPTPPPKTPTKKPTPKVTPKASPVKKGK